MKSDKKELLSSYIKSNIAPIMIDFLNGNDILDSVILEAGIDKSELNGHYEGEKFVAPKWYDELKNKEKVPILVIDGIDKITKEEQLKFAELLEYRKISTFDLPKKCVIIVTAKKINSEKINEEIYSLVAHI